jgi:hypothetical protein
VLYPVVFIAMVFMWRRIQREREFDAEGRIRLPDDPSEEEEVARARARAHGRQNGSVA